MTDLADEADDTTLPSTGYMFGADSNAAVRPSKYTVAAANAAICKFPLDLTSATIPGTSSLLMPNNKGIHGLDSGGVDRAILNLSNGDAIDLGTGTSIPIYVYAPTFGPFTDDSITFGSAARRISALHTRKVYAENVGVMSARASVDFNVGNTDTAIAITLPQGVGRYRMQTLQISGASASLTTATCGLFTAAGGGGVAIVPAASAITVSTSADNTNNNMMVFNATNTNTQSYTATTLYFRVATPQGSAATGTVTLQYIPVS